jgi:hypothetical protein
MLQFVPNYVPVVGETFVPSSLHATKNNIKNITSSTNFLESFSPLMCQKRQRSDFNRQIVSIESFEFVILCLYSFDSFRPGFLLNPFVCYIGLPATNVIFTVDKLGICGGKFWSLGQHAASDSR